jgi:hypothetical protein
MSNFGAVFSGTLAGIVGAYAAFYTVTKLKLFGGTTPIDQNDAWQVKSEDLMIDGKWVRLLGSVRSEAIGD